MGIPQRGICGAADFKFYPENTEMQWKMLSKGCHHQIDG